MTYDQLETERLVLEPIAESHAPAMFEHLKDARLYEYIEEKPPPSMEVLEKRYKTWRSFWDENPNELWFNWAARIRGTNDYVGYVQATVRPAYALLAWVVFVERQRQGYAREATEAMIEHLANAWGVSAVRATIDPRNAASIELARALGLGRIGNQGTDLLFSMDLRRI